MEKVISLIFDIEHKANQIIERADIEKGRLFEENEKATAEMESDIAENNTSKINELNAKAEEDFEKERTLILENSELKLKEIETQNLINHEMYVNKIFNSIIQI